jgi:hypothetical protein
MPQYRSSELPSISTLPVTILLAVATAIVVLTVLSVTALVSRAWDHDTPGAVTAVATAGSLAVAMGAVWAAILTLSKQQEENLRHRQMATLHLLNDQYDAIFSDVYKLRSKTAASGGEGQAKFPREEMRLIYTRYFTCLATCFRYYQLGLVPQQDFVEWTCSLIARFAKERCIIDFDDPPEGSEIRRKWEGYQRRIYGPRVAFRSYINEIWSAVSKDDVLQVIESPEDLIQLAKRIVAKVAPSGEMRHANFTA